MTIDIYTVIPLLLIQLAGSNIIGSATGFLWKDVPKSQYYLVTNYHVGSATQVMLATRFRATVGQKQTRKQGDQQQSCSSEMRAQYVDQVVLHR